MKAYEQHGYKVSRCTPHHAGVTKAWADIYRYVASTAWGKAADLQDLAARSNWPIYKKPEHAFSRKAASANGKELGDHEGSSSMTPVRAESPGRFRSQARSGTPDVIGRVASTASVAEIRRTPSTASQRGPSTTEFRLSQRRMKPASPPRRSASPTRGTSSFATR